MVLMRLFAVVCLCTLVSAVSGQSQVPEDLQKCEGIAGTHSSDAVHQLAKGLSLARKSGDVSRVRELEAALFETLPTLPPDIEILGGPGNDDVLPEESAAPLWGNDVRIYTGPVWTNGKRQLAIDADTVRGIYVGINAKYQDTLSQLVIYRSTNEGKNWSFVNRFYSGVYPIQSFDICVTDTLGGKWLIGIAFVLKTDKSTNGGGHLYWGSMLNDGTDWRYTLIATATSSINFKNPSICTDGTNYHPNLTYHYIAAEYLNPATDISRGLYFTRTTNWGKNWTAPDTSLRGAQENAPVIGIDWSTNPDSLCLAFTRGAPGNRNITTARNSFTATGGWYWIMWLYTTDDYDPSMAIDPVRGNAMVTYTRNSGAPKYEDAMCLYSTDLFKTFKRDSIAASTASEALTSVNYAPAGGTNYYWRVAYRSSLGNDTIYYKSIPNSMSGFYTATAVDVSQYRPTASVMPVVGFDRESAGNYLGNCVYVGYGGTNVYFDAVDLFLDVPLETGLPGRFALDQNYPNPFNPKTNIRYHIPSASNVRLVVFDQLGREVAQLVNERKDAGSYVVQFDGSRAASGVYYYRLEADGRAESRKLILLK